MLHIPSTNKANTNVPFPAYRHPLIRCQRQPTCPPSWIVQATLRYQRDDHPSFAPSTATPTTSNGRADIPSVFSCNTEATKLPLWTKHMYRIRQASRIVKIWFEELRINSSIYSWFLALLYPWIQASLCHSYRVLHSCESCPSACSRSKYQLVD